jgi:DNA-binding transcriptional ArsR family regulator
MGNSIYWRNFRGKVAREVARYLPLTWSVELRDVKGQPAADGFLVLRAPDGAAATVALEFNTELTPRAADAAWQKIASLGEPSLLIAPYISKRTQAYLREHGMFYLDFEGSAWWRLDAPALTVSVVSDAEPPKAGAGRRRFRGVKAGRLMRYLCDHRPPVSVAELSLRLSIDRGNVSRYLDVLRDEAIVTRGARGAVVDVDWEALLRRWADDYRRPLQERYLDPRGRDHFVSTVCKKGAEYALSGVLGASFYAPYSVDIATFCYCDAPSAFASSLGLREEKRAANVVLAIPFDPIVYSTAQVRDGVLVAAPTQVAIDLLSGHGRELQQAEEVIRWMKEHERDWRA